MTSVKHIVATLALAASCTGDPGATGDTGPQGNQGSQGDPGEPASTTGTIAGIVSDGVAGDPLAGVAVTAADTGGGVLASATTGSDGRFSVTVPAGPVDLAFAKDRYTSPGTLASGVGIGETVQVAVSMSESATGRPSLVLAAAGDDFGYGAAVPLTATATDPDGDALSYTWSNATTPALGAVAGSGSAGIVTLPAMADAFAPRVDPANPGGAISGYDGIGQRFGIIPILTDTRGQVTAKVAVDDGRGQVATASLTLDAASVTGNIGNIAVGQRVYLNSGHSGAAAWTLASKSCDPARDVACVPTSPCDPAAALDDPTSRTPSFVAAKSCLYTLSEGTNAITIAAGSWHGAIAHDGKVPNAGDPFAVDEVCATCHVQHIDNVNAPDYFTPWMKTGHATMFTNGIDGDIGEHYSNACIGCHTVGYDLGVANNGFDDVALANDWTFPLSLDAANWSNLYDSQAGGHVAALANVQCESCHGPNDSDAHTKTQDASFASQPFTSPRISYSAEACATCHAAGDHHIYSEWTSAAEPWGGVAMSHGNRGTANLGAGATGLSTSCGRCHTAQGYTLYADLLNQGTPVITMTCTINGVKQTGQACDAKLPAAATLAQVTGANAEPVTCTACHDPHDATNPNQLRVYDAIAMTPAGFGVAGFGKGASCVSCHNSRNGTIATSDTFTFLHESTETKDAGAGAGNPPSYSAPHQADQADVFTGHNAYFMGANMPMTSKHAAVTDTCVGCHMTLNPATRVSFGAPATNDHTFFIAEADEAKLCANCHGSGVNGAAIQAQVEAQLGALDAKVSSALIAKVAALPDRKINVLAHDPATDTTSPLFTLDTSVTPIVSASFIEVHGQVSLTLTLASAVTIPWGATTPAKTLSVFDVQLGALKDNQATPVVLYPLTGNFIRAGWNYFLIEGDQSKGLHNPSFVTAVLNTTLNQDLTN